jgi:hypothetical protein
VGFFNLPKKLISLTFGHCFNQPVNNLPETLTLLTFGNTFNRQVDNLPKTLISLTFCHYFNRPIDNLPTARPLGQAPKGPGKLKFSQGKH